MRKRIIFHLPFKISVSHASGTNIRPMQMLEAFKKSGHEVDMIEGTAQERKAKISAIKQKIRKGQQYDLLYSESSTEPTLLTEKHHLPFHPFLDFGFFRFCRQYNIPVGLFYRDIYWKFSFYGTHISSLKRNIARAFYRYDLKKYEELVDVLYLPSLKMKTYLPPSVQELKIQELPPAAPNMGGKVAEKLWEKGKLNILYVGGIGGQYRIHKLLEAVRGIEGVTLTICCRQQDWDNHQEEYQPLLNNSINLVHKQQEELKELFASADVAAFFVEPGEYVSFAIPLKIFEYMSFGKPVIVSDGTASADFVKRNDTGWAVDYSREALEVLLDKLLTEGDLIDAKKANIYNIIHLHTWESRAVQVINDLTRS